MINIVYEEENNMSAAYDGEKRIGLCAYVPEDAIWLLNKTVVDKEYGGQGIAKQLLDRLAEEARRRGIKLKAICSYVVKAFEKYDDYADVILKDAE